jgi:Trk K+ transport system NAD-binding subunit
MDGHSPISRSGHVVVFGFQGVARRIVRQLINAGQDIVVVDPKISHDERHDLERWGVQYFEGSGQRENTLRSLSLTTAKAALCVNEDDLRNIEIALLVREAAPELRIVMYAANQAVGRAIAHVTQPGAVLDVAQLASDSFVETVVRRNIHSIQFGDEEFLVATFRNEARGKLRSTWQDLAPVAVQPIDGGELISCPGRDFESSRGDLVTLIGTKSEFDYLGITLPRDREVQVGKKWRRGFRESLYAISDAVDRPFRVALGALVALGVISVAILAGSYSYPDGSKMSPFDAVYFTSETIATVGFGDFYFRDQDIWLRLWAVILILLGATLVAVTTALLTNALVSRRLAQSLGQQRLTKMRDHMVVVGLGSVGIKVVTDLKAAGYEVAVIDRSENNKYAPQVRAAGIPLVFGDATLPETLSAAGVERAAGVAVLTSDDLINIETGLAVRDASTPRTIPVALRLFERDLARVVGRSLDAGLARSTAELAAPWFVGAALDMDVLGTFYVGNTLFMAAKLHVRAGSGLDGLAMQNLATQTRVVALSRVSLGGAVEHPPRRDTSFVAGDIAFVIGQPRELLNLLQASE